MTKHLKKGDIITPKATRKQSNYFKLDKLKKVEITSVHNLNITNTSMTVKIIEGTARSSEQYGTSTKGARITIYAGAFDLVGEKEPNYSVW